MVKNILDVKDNLYLVSWVYEQGKTQKTHQQVFIAKHIEEVFSALGDLYPTLLPISVNIISLSSRLYQVSKDE